MPQPEEPSCFLAICDKALPDLVRGNSIPLPPPSPRLTSCNAASMLSSMENHRDGRSYALVGVSFITSILTKEGSQMKQILTFTGAVTSALLFSTWAFAQYQPPVIPTVPTISDIKAGAEQKAAEERGKVEGKAKAAVDRAEEKSKKSADKAAMKAEQAQKKVQQETEKAAAKAEKQKHKAETKAIQMQGKVTEQTEKVHNTAAGHIEKAETKTSREIEKAEKKLLGEGK